MEVKMFFVVLAAIPTAIAAQSAVTALGWAVEKQLKRRRLLRLMQQVAYISAMADAADGVAERVAEATRAEFGDDGVAVFRSIEIGGAAYCATDAQIELLNAVLEEKGDARAALLLAQIYQQTVANSRA